jgi:hypothetical protein
MHKFVDRDSDDNLVRVLIEDGKKSQ